MPLYRLRFMEQTVETYLIEASDERTAWATEPWQLDDEEPEDEDCTLYELHDVEEVEDDE